MVTAASWVCDAAAIRRRRQQVRLEAQIDTALHVQADRSARRARRGDVQSVSDFRAHGLIEMSEGDGESGMGDSDSDAGWRSGVEAAGPATLPIAINSGSRGSGGLSAEQAAAVQAHSQQHAAAADHTSAGARQRVHVGAAPASGPS